MNHLYMIAGVGTVGAVGGGVYLVHNSISKIAKPDLRSRLIDDKYSIMEDSHSNWTTVLGKYNDSSILPSKKFSELRGTVTDTVLKSKCKEVLSSNDDVLYEKAKLWCTVPRTVQQRLEDLGIHTLKMTGDNEEGDKTKWETLLGKYKASTAEQKIKGLEISVSSGVTEWQALRTGCNGHISKDRWDVDYDYYLGKVTDWCSSSSKLLND